MSKVSKIFRMTCYCWVNNDMTKQGYIRFIKQLENSDVNHQSLFPLELPRPRPRPPPRPLDFGLKFNNFLLNFFIQPSPFINFNPVWNPHDLLTHYGRGHFSRDHHDRGLSGLLEKCRNFELANRRSDRLFQADINRPDFRLLFHCYT